LIEASDDLNYAADGDAPVAGLALEIDFLKSASRLASYFRDQANTCGNRQT